MELDAEFVGVILHTVAVGGAHLDEIVDLFVGRDAVGIIDIAVRTGQRDDLRAERGGLLADAPGNVAEARAGDGLALERLALVLEHLVEVVNRAVAGRLRTDQRAAVGLTLAGQDAVLPLALQATVLAEEIADLTAADTHITGRDVAVRPDVAIERRHEALAETHDLRVGLAGRVEVGAALAAADGQAGQAVLEDLLKAQKLDDALVHGGVEP